MITAIWIRNFTKHLSFVYILYRYNESNFCEIFSIFNENYLELVAPTEVPTQYLYEALQILQMMKNHIRRYSILNFF